MQSLHSAYYNPSCNLSRVFYNVLNGGVDMSFVVKDKKKVCDNATITIRIPKTLLAKFDELASDSGRTRTELITKALEYAIDNLERKHN